MYESRLQVRIEAARIAVSSNVCKDVDDVLRLAKAIETYVSDGIEMQDIVDVNKYIVDIFAKMNDGFAERSNNINKISEESNAILNQIADETVNEND